MSDSVYIIAAKRTPIGKFQGVFKSTPATKLGSLVIQDALDSTQLDPNLIDECIMGQVLTAGCGQSPARQAAIGAQLPKHTKTVTVNKVCGSGLKSVALGASSILLQHANLVVCGGQENMSRAPYLLPQARDGFRMGHKECLDSMILDGLWDPYHGIHMGSCAEECAREFQISRIEQDKFALESYEKARNASENDLFQNEITPVQIQQGKETVIVQQDEEPFAADLSKIQSLRPAFDKNGTITAGNASSISDGAAAVILAHEKFIRTHRIKPMAKIVAWGEFAQEPKQFPIAPIGAILQALKRAHLSLDDIDLFEINEAFAAVVLVIAKQLNIPLEHINIHGGACALGHPIGASGARILTTLIHAMQLKNKRYGLATLCIGGGEGIAMIIEQTSE